MTNRYGEPIRDIRRELCPDCKTTTEMIHQRVRGDVDIRRCGDCGEEVELELLVHAKPSEVTYPGAAG
ncbi:hypothetical protein [Streptomyces sp. NPDC051572]|uniref:hypothetical protein n=1 Tax=Streptomyces sp. NPDC051572 TaxID=3155802 RepID=UPI00344D6791